MTRALDILQSVLFLFIALLLLTGGVKTPTWELAQVDLFGWALLLVTVARQLRTGVPLSPQLSQWLSHWLAPFVRRHGVKAAIVAYCALHFAVLRAKYGSFDLEAYDLGFVGQAVWSTAHLPQPAHFLHSSLSRGGTYLGEHFSPILAVLAIPVRFFPERASIFVDALFCAQVALMGASAWLLYLLARQRKLGEGAAAAVVALFLLYQPTRAAMHFAFREDLFFIPLIFAALLALERKRTVSFWACCAAICLVKENGPLVTALLAVPLFLKRRKGDGIARDGIALIVVSALIFWVINAKVMPAWAPSTGDIGTVASRRMGGALGPLLASKFEWKTLRYLVQVLLPFAVVAVPCWSWLGAAALVAMNLIISLRMVGFHYECVTIPFLMYGFITALQARPAGPKRRFAGIIAACALLAVFGRSPVLALRQHWPRGEHRCLESLLQALPPKASIATQSGLFPHLMARQDIFLRGLATALQEDYLVVSKLPGISTYATPLLMGWLDSLSTQRPDYHLLFEDGRLRVWCRAPVCTSTNTLAAVRALSNIQAACSTH